MTGWTGGYVSDIPYTSHFYREMTPTHMAFTALAVGRHPGGALRPQRVLELGCGMGFGLVLMAAAYPDVHFEGVDFLPEHITHARGLIEEAGLTNIDVHEASFQELAVEAQEGQQDLDMIMLHGILSWVPDEARQAIIEIARKRLKPGGLLYVSYNCMPAMGPFAPLRRLLLEHAKRAGGRSDQRAKAGAELLKALAGEGARVFGANPGLVRVVDRLVGRDGAYLAHEYLNGDWAIFHFPDVAEMMGRAKLDFVGSATLAENIDGLCVPEGSRARIAGEHDPIFREMLKDIVADKGFRRDVYGRGAAKLISADRMALLNEMRFVLTVPRHLVSYSFSTALGDANGKPELFDPIFDLLAEGAASFSEISARFGPQQTSEALEALTLLVYTGQAMPVRYGAAEGQIDAAAAHGFNRMIARKALVGQNYVHLASPVLGSGIQVSPIEMLMFAAVLEGRGDAVDGHADYVVHAMQRLGMSRVRDGRTITDPEESRKLMREDSETFLSKKLPLWRRLGLL